MPMPPPHIEQEARQIGIQKFLEEMITAPLLCSCLCLLIRHITREARRSELSVVGRVQADQKVTEAEMEEVGGGEGLFCCWMFEVMNQF